MEQFQYLGSVKEKKFSQSVGKDNIQLRFRENISVQAPHANKLYEEIKNIDRIRTVFDDQLDLDTRNLLLSWDPVKSRNRYEQCQTQNERKAWCINEIEEVTTSLRERYNCLENPMDLYIDENSCFRNKKFPADTLETILRRGVAYQETHGSKELERERREVEGILKVQADLTHPEAENGDTRIIFSPPGMMEDSPYTKHFVDTYTLVIDQSGKRTIDAKRYATEMTYQQYKDAAELLDPGYFNGKEGQLDAIFLGNPIALDGFGDIQGLFDEILTFDSEALRGYEFDVVNKIIEPIKPLLVQSVINFDPEIIAQVLNTIFAIGDEAEEMIRVSDMVGLNRMLTWSKSVSLEEIFEEIEVRGNVQVQGRQVGCGDSGSFVNSVGQFGARETDQYGPLKFECPSCRQTNTRPSGVLIPNCKHCLSDVSCRESADHGKKDAEDKKKKKEKEKAKEKKDVDQHKNKKNKENVKN